MVLTSEFRSYGSFLLEWALFRLLIRLALTIRGLSMVVSSRRDGAIVAWHEVPGNATPKRPSRRVRCEVSRRFRKLSMTRNTSGISFPIIPYPTGRFFRGGFSRHFVPGYDQPVPPGHYSPIFRSRDEGLLVRAARPFSRLVSINLEAVSDVYRRTDEQIKFD